MSGNDVRGRTPLSLVGQDPDLLFYTRQASERGGPVLVLGAANGRVPWSLAVHGYSAVGVDASTVMIRSAEERRARESTEAGERVRFISSDVRVLRLTEQFPLVLAPQHAMGLMATPEDLGVPDHGASSPRAGGHLHLRRAEPAARGHHPRRR